jgi:uncharacterized protein
MSSWLRAFAAIAVFSTGAAFADTPPSVPTPEDGVRQVQERKAAEYHKVLAAFDAAMQSAPHDVSVAIARCRFINQFTDDEYGDWVESAPQDFEVCQDALQSRWNREPAAQMFALEQMWGEEAAEQGEKLLKNAGNWPAPLRRDLLVKVSEAQENEDNAARAGELAAQAVRLGDTGRVALAVEYLVSRKKFAEAERVLASAPPATEAWRAKERVEAAFGLPDRKAALKELKRYARSGWDINAAIAARAYLHAGDVAMARKLLKNEDGETETLQKVRFEVALAAKDYKAATASVQLTDVENFSDNLQRFVTLARQSPATLLSWPMLQALLICALVTIGLALLPAAVLLPAHYRGLIRRVRGKPAAPLFEAVGLGRAWWAAAVFFVVPSVFGLIAEPEAISIILGGERLPAGKAVFGMMLWGTLAGLLFLVPATRKVGMRQLIGDRAALRASWRVLVSWACLFAVAALLSWWHSHSGENSETMQTRTMTALVDGGTQTYGPALTLLLIAGLVPVFEELVFRGFLLGGLTRHISFGWANTLQALLFAAAHGDPPRFVFYLTMGLLAGWLVRKTNALGPAIALHVLNNAMAFFLKVF